MMDAKHTSNRPITAVWIGLQLCLYPGALLFISEWYCAKRGSHAQLLAANGVYRKLWDDQGHTQHNAAGQADDDDDDDEDDDDEE
jgi:hypothetical protein